jgi:hypothetical protein
VKGPHRLEPRQHGRCRDSYQKAISIFNKLSHQKPEDAQLLADQLRAYGKMADIKVMEGDTQGALDLDLRIRQARETG